MNTIPDTGWQAGFLSVLPAVRTHARIQFRRLRPDLREEAVQEAIASACISYRRLFVRGRLDFARPAMIAAYAVHFVRNRRHVGGRQETARDAMSPRAQLRHGFRTCSYDSEAGPWRQMAIAGRKTCIADLAAFRIDFGRWLLTLTRRDRKVIAAFVSGERTSAVARRLGICSARVSQLRRRYERAWRVFQGEPRATRAA